MRHQLFGPLWRSPNLEYIAIRILYKGADETGRCIEMAQELRHSTSRQAFNPILTYMKEDGTAGQPAILLG
jgi:hypothetical protein